MRWLILGGAVLLVGCGGENPNPVGAGLVDRRDLGRVIRLNPISPSQKVTTYLGIRPVVNGSLLSMAAGSLNRIGLTALVRFTAPTDEILSASGGKDIRIVRSRLLLTRRSAQGVGSGPVTVWQPLAGWDEQSIFADTTRGVEAPIPLGRIDFVQMADQADTTVIDLAPSFVRGRLRVTGRAAGTLDTVEVALQAAPGAQFLTTWVATNALEEGISRPRLVLTYETPDSLKTLTLIAAHDTFYGVREGGGPDSASLTVGTGFRYWTYLTFPLPDSLPRRATINSARLEAEVAQPGSFPAGVVLGVDRLVISPTTRDTSIAQGGTVEVLAGATSLSVEIGPFVVQAWTTGQVENRGVVLLPVGGADLISWVVLRNPRLTIVYSLPPGTE
ncbi:MAG: hypothetical protein A3F84_29540 [Candidatus Handelsmanbacteria bacterium RIFCSPLOWO2_12_FULL_64_10]|uniref:DNRLRE domain-containing protein n=1 Tax=Handelsmanbacteria sp. (strain RIFCSPLOWO2_12_FULL_64_10) TaxID=1817868 RepID=A0A1F6C2U1_HANXR|nr:MAG: hypothetical protein A3F84_29540 [Candidatus Handelsmanbacteria bacterium RIFCSPLOWO2_12_FULL_64_10]